MQPSSLRLLRALAFNRPLPCQSCHQKSFQTISRRAAASTPPEKLAAAPQTPPPPPPPPEKPAVESKASQRERLQESVEKKGFVLEPLGRPIGYPLPPRPGDNDGVDRRSRLEKRQELKDKFFRKSYFRDWKALDNHQGKTYIANPLIYKADTALYFPNFRGSTLATSTVVDTTPVLRDRVSVVTFTGTHWAENQVATFIGATANPRIRELVDGSAGTAQFVHINVEENIARSWLLDWLVKANQRRGKTDEDKKRYFMVRTGLSDDIKQTIGIMNRIVGYVFLVDGDCKIRWAGSGDASDDEREWMVKGLRRLIDENEKAKGGKKGTAVGRKHVQS
ncbi:hypothetical protein K402DRAFT_265467 [Aulographum hederae CBS 113979]|uniref:F1F0 ATP synthase assembly protein Atp10 n=1 Tax=Aulographum hederae CBS 113979 TaxID=1176131 RepID=A0A6G1GJ31_9PEZI|nr:hypothetical protein K402DRAFT_265467 [Aulographum hederae CBS 113979]